jgi:multidrug efflux pump subunit AcrA (membrane-fusion protein)
MNVFSAMILTLQKRSRRFTIAITSLLIAVIATTSFWLVLHDESDHASDIACWTCPMHPQIKEDRPGQCPICHMDLVPVKKKPPVAENKTGESTANTEANTEHDHSKMETESGSPGTVEVSIERQQLIGLKTAIVEEKELHTSIRTTGRVAFDPELAVAIREYLTIAAGDPGLRQYAITRLKMLGMGEEEIRTLPARRKEYESLYLQGGGNTTWVYAALYQNDLPLVKPGMKARIRLPGSGSEGWEGTVRSVSPTVDPDTRNLQARIEVKNAADLKPDMYVNVSILSKAGRGLVIPRDALIDTGTEQLVYVVRNGTHFSPRRVRVGREADEGIVILSGLSAGEIVVASATFLIDSESRLRGE